MTFKASLAIRRNQRQNQVYFVLSSQLHEDENLATFEPSFGLFNFSDPSTGVIGTRSFFSGNVYDRRTTPIKLEESGQGFQPVVIPVPLDGVIGTFSSISLVTRGLPAQDFDPDNPSTKITITQISYTAYLCVNEIAADPLGPVLGCLLLQYGATFPTSIDADVSGGTGMLKGASGMVVNVVMLVVLDLIITLDSDLPNYMLATRSPTCGKQSCTDNFEYGFEGDASKDCDWAAKKSNKRCKKKDSRTKKMISFHCPSVCDSECTKKKRPKKSKGS
ncbi:hypothetical protein FRACYDRAFT_235265 [Fragilariopsis cylindrus CCMP1102]|uniref:Uncharacterized protein n=1 Tax=Fragilariopsis cylindrus CCMP1102 TaxID=635003 RepID=A0A1E7FU09_9STRA|nr:hypothetical protein FRACYDRAFT_235265 [Fragilariopsis cylindrus CCMP1102]|eukprot:OEU21639.1 hypothetical protein FRACYDRAFT_235265 [Fragilariopsis cylindrus CCMP1102]